MRILVVGMTDNPGGMESVVMNYVRNSDSQAMHFDFLSTYPHIAYEKELRARGALLTSIPSRHSNPFMFRRELASYMKKNAAQYDVLWFNTCNLVNIDFLKYAYKYRIPKIVVHCHNSQNMDNSIKNILHHFNQQKVLKYATDYWTCSEEATDWFYGTSIRNNPHYLYLPNSINPDSVKFNIDTRNAIRKEMNWNDKIILGCVARLHPQKNQSFLLDAFAPVFQNSNKYRLVLVGDGELRESLEKQADFLGISEAVQFLGVRSDITDLYQGMDAFLLPSKFEGVSMALLEAQANGLPCIISDTLSDEGVMNNNVIKLPITDSGRQAWCDAINSVSSHTLTRIDNEKISGSQHDIHVQVKQFYKQLSR